MFSHNQKIIIELDILKDFIQSLLSGCPLCKDSLQFKDFKKKEGYIQINLVCKKCNKSIKFDSAKKSKNEDKIPDLIQTIICSFYTLGGSAKFLFEFFKELNINFVSYETINKIFQKVNILLLIKSWKKKLMS